MWPLRARQLKSTSVTKDHLGHRSVVMRRRTFFQLVPCWSLLQSATYVERPVGSAFSEPKRRLAQRVSHEGRAKRRLLGEALS